MYVTLPCPCPVPRRICILRHGSLSRFLSCLLVRWFFSDRHEFFVSWGYHEIHLVLFAPHGFDLSDDHRQFIRVVFLLAPFCLVVLMTVLLVVSPGSFASPTAEFVCCFSLVSHRAFITRLRGLSNMINCWLPWMCSFVLVLC